MPTYENAEGVKRVTREGSPLDRRMAADDRWTQMEDDKQETMRKTTSSRRRARSRG